MGVRVRDRRELKLSAQELDVLLYEFLTALIVMKDADSLLFREFDVSVREGNKTLVCHMKGERIDRKRHRLRSDVKAVTMHMFEVRKEKVMWRATVVLDI